MLILERTPALVALYPDSKLRGPRRPEDDKLSPDTLPAIHK